MLTKNQYKFLKKFKKEARRFMIKDKDLSEIKHEKMDLNCLITLLLKHPELNPAEPLNKEELDTGFAYRMVKNYLESIGLSDMISNDNPELFGISQTGIECMDEYQLERYKSVKIPWIAIGVSVLSLVASVSAIIISLCTNK